MPISWPHYHVTSAVNSAIDCNQPISTYHNQLVKPVPSHKVCTPVFATRHALACYPNTRFSSELLPAGRVYAMACDGPEEPLAPVPACWRRVDDCSATALIAFLAACGCLPQFGNSCSSVSVSMAETRMGMPIPVFPYSAIGDSCAR
jgi:hypothetical protein